MSKKTILIAVFCTLAVLLHGADFLLYKEGRPMTDLVVKKVDPALTDLEKRKVDSALNEFLSRIKKCGLPPMVLTEKSRNGKPEVAVYIKEKEIEYADEYVIDFPGKNVLRIQATSTSIKHALDDILERCFGVCYLLHTPHWLKPPKGYSREIEYIYPRLKTVSAPRKTIIGKASFNLRRNFSGDIPKEWKLRSGFPSGHGMTQYAFPASKYAPDNSWPVEILPIHKGKRYKMPKYRKPSPEKLKNAHYKHVAQYIQYMGDWNPCFSNPKTAQIAAANILEKLEKEVVSPLYGYKYYCVDLGVNDNGGNCECAKCLAVIAKSPRGVFGTNYSELYWKWVNDVAEIVTKKYPKMYFTCLAYREVTLPPSFKLHPRVIPTFCRELNTGVIPAQRKNIEKIFQSWVKKASMVSLWDYSYGSKYFLFPTIYFSTHAEMMKMAHKYNVRGSYCEGSDRINMCGPKMHLIARTMWNVNTDVKAELKKWCLAAVGPKAAPELEQYYLFWENYWKRPSVHKTNFFNSASNIYMTLGDSGSYTYGIRKGELASLRKLLENVIRKAVTPDQKARAKHFLNVFAISEDAAKCLYSEYIEPDGFVKDAANAVLLLRSVPEAFKALNRLKKNPLVVSPQLDLYLMRPLTIGVGNFRSISKFTKDPAVRKELEKISADKTLPTEIRAQAKILLGVRFKNLMNENGSFEKPIPATTYWQIYRGKVQTKLFTDGKRSFGGVNALVREVQDKGLVYGKKYMVLVDVYAAKNSAEGYVNLLVNPMSGERRNTGYVLLSNLKLQQGWQTLSNTISLTGKRQTPASQIFIQVWGNKFEKDEPIYFDNIRIYQLD